MIHWRRKDYDNPPAKLLTQKCAKQIQKAVIDQDGSKYTNTYYRNAEVLKKLKAYSIDQNVFNENTNEAKCFYCESYTETVASLQVEHYRPKSKVTDENGLEIEGTNGYYWLGCEWSNLLLACPKCNGRGAKGTKFPITGHRITNENPIIINEIPNTEDTETIFDRTNCFANRNPLRNEQPLLLNPELDIIVEHFTFNSNGVINSNTEKGLMSIRICNLDRAQLNIARKRLYDSLISLVNLEIIKCDRGIILYDRIGDAFEIICEEIIACNQPAKQYTLWANYFNDNFEEMFVDNVPERYKQPLRNAFQVVSNNVI